MLDKKQMGQLIVDQRQPTEPVQTQREGNDQDPEECRKIGLSPASARSLVHFQLMLDEVSLLLTIGLIADIFVYKNFTRNCNFNQPESIGI